MRSDSNSSAQPQQQQQLPPGSTSTSSADFAQAMYVTLWPKVEKCHTYVAVLLAAQAQLQATIEQLITALREAEQADASALVGYAHRLQSFPLRVAALQRKLETIDDRLVAIKHVQHRDASRTNSATTSVVVPREAYASPLF